MSKYIDADKLIKLVKEWRSKQMGFAWVAVNDVLQIITSLQQEQPETDLEKELSKHVSKGIHRFFPKEGDDYCRMDSVVWQDYTIETARHFYELGKIARKEE